jgi:hypothetical protein
MAKKPGWVWCENCRIHMTKGVYEIHLAEKHAFRKCGACGKDILSLEFAYCNIPDTFYCDGDCKKVACDKWTDENIDNCRICHKNPIDNGKWSCASCRADMAFRKKNAHWSQKVRTFYPPSN